MEIETPEENQFIGGLVQSHGGTGYFSFFVGGGGGGGWWDGVGGGGGGGGSGRGSWRR